MFGWVGDCSRTGRAQHPSPKFYAGICHASIIDKNMGLPAFDLVYCSRHLDFMIMANNTAATALNSHFLNED
jgi:hypothetical protein